MRLGYHVSIGKGLLKAIDQGMRTGCECVQTFSRNPRGWKIKPLDAEQCKEFHKARLGADLKPMAVHLPYLPNLASTDSELWEKSVLSLAEEIYRADILGADYIVAHPGRVKGDENPEEGMERVARGIHEALSRTGGNGKAMILLETTSGQGGELGRSFTELARMIKDIETSVRRRDLIGVCLDTAHIWAAGYDLAGPKKQDETLNQFDSVLGMKRLKLIHLNDSLSELGGRRDRHAAVGKGRIGARAMASFVRRPELSHLGAIMETPFVSEEDDLVNMNRAKKWRGRKTVAT